MKKKIISSLIIGVAVLAVVLLLQNRLYKFFDSINRGYSSLLFNLREADPKPLAEQYLPNPYIYHKTKLLGIDEPSLNVFGKWPWYRDVHAQMLRSVEQYSPATVHFDIGFILPEKMPDSLGRELQKKNQSLIPVVRNAFDSIDQALIDELAKHNNVLVDLFVDRRSQNYSLSPRLLSRIQTTEYYATNYSQPVSAMTKKIFGTNIFFDKIEPVLAGIAANSQPVSVTIMPDSSDNVVRSFPLLNLYRSTDNKELGLFTIVLGLLMDFYRIDRDHIQIKPEKITLYSARVPRLDKYNVPQQKTVSFPKLKKLLTVDRQNTKY
ncbi:MAG TPA: CHASE2 domain-containing protein, partial [Spirochaetota bacterium]|nr:CHASE2 domain-containing protein [Spirochaetota bacterium]